MAPHDPESSTLQRCLSSLTGIVDAELDLHLPELGDAVEHGADARLTIRADSGQVDYLVLAKPRLPSSLVEAVTHEVKGRFPSDLPVLVMTEYVAPETAEELIARGIEFVDAVGNAHLHRPPMFVRVVGRKREARAPSPQRAFRAAGLQLIYVFLKDPGSVNSTYRELAAWSGVSLGQISVVVRQLKGLGILAAVDDEKWGLLDPRDLLRRWEERYLESLRPRILLETCRPAKDRTMEGLVTAIQESDLRERILIGGELGASVLAGTLRPETATLHLEVPHRKAMTELRLLPEQGGPVSLLKTFGQENAYRMEGERSQGTVAADPLLIHAELKTRAGDRVVRVASEILDRFIEPRWEDA